MVYSTVSYFASTSAGLSVHSPSSLLSPSSHVHLDLGSGDILLPKEVGLQLAVFLLSSAHGKSTAGSGHAHAHMQPV